MVKEASPTAIVLDGNQRAALATVRSLGRKGVVVKVAESIPGSLAAASRYCSASMICPDASQAPEAFIAWLEELNRSDPGAVLMPMTDVTVPLVLKSAARLPTLHTALPSLDAYETVSDKFRLFEIANAMHVRVPQTQVVSRATVKEIRPQDYHYPVVVKPRRSAMHLSTGLAKRAVKYAANGEDLLEIVKQQLLDDEDELLIQEHVVGHGAGVFGMYQHGQPLTFFAHRRLREKPPSGGVSVFCESVPLPTEALAHARALLGGLSWHGVAMVEFKIDAAGTPWLIEINARFWGSLQLAVDCGADFPWLVYQLAAGRTPGAQHDYLVGKRLRNWLGDFDGLYARVRSRKWTPRMTDKFGAIAQFLWPWPPRTRYELFRLDDPLPAMAALRQYIVAHLHG